MAGQIIKRGDRKYLVRVYMGREGGKRKYHNKTIHGNKKDAERYLNKVLRDRDTGTFVEPSQEPLSEYLDKWLKTAVKPRVATSTYRSYTDIVTYYLKPDLGDYKISQLDPQRIQEFYNSLLERGLSTRTVRYAHAVLRNAVNQAVKWGKLYRNPVELVDLPRHEKEEMKILTPEEAAKFMEATVYSPWQALFSLLLASGMRPGEALGLKWSDIDFDRGRVHVRRTLVRISKEWKLEEPKTSRSKRAIPLPKGVMEDLTEHKKRQTAEKLRAKSGTYNDQGIVFAGKTGEPLNHRNIVNRHFKPLLKDSGLPEIRLYDLRHTCATLLLAAGENPKIVSERLGHASVTITLDTYSHVLPDMQAAAAEKLEDMLFNGRHTNS